MNFTKQTSAFGLPPPSPLKADVIYGQSLTTNEFVNLPPPLADFASIHTEVFMTIFAKIRECNFGSLRRKFCEFQ